MRFLIFLIIQLENLKMQPSLKIFFHWKIKLPFKWAKSHSNPCLNFDFENKSDVPLRRSKRPKIAKDFVTSLLIKLQVSLQLIKRPWLPQKLLLERVINDESTYFLANKTWILTNGSGGCKTIGSKWIFRRSSEMMALLKSRKLDSVSTV